MKSYIFILFNLLLPSYFQMKSRDISGTPVFLLRLSNLKRNPDEKPGLGSIPLKSIVIFKQAQRAVELSNRTGSRSRSESAGIKSTVRSYLYPVNRTQTDDPIYGREWAR